MFKIENYIAPLILSKVEKFVKNINQPQEHFQVSLWQGDVVFQNLELKLDVLEEELQLPIQFLSGHINDLKIQIPWTKIASEPIIITINTIELVVKLKDFSSSTTVQKPKLKKKISIDEDAQAGYMASLIAKILNNMSIICNNIVLKFIEEDIVVSMNIQHLSVHSADHRWRRSFIDVSPTNVLFRKLINIIDLTICLDKRNSSGKIEYVQEPIVYKCSMELRLYRKYHSNTPSKLSITRIDIQTNSLNLSISSQQFPMLMRLYDLIMALKTGKLQAKYAENVQSQPSAEADDPGADESWLLWAWNMIPALLPDEEPLEHDETSDKKIFEFGLYVDEIHLSLKSQEFLSDPIIPSTKKAVFKPLISIYAQEFYSTTVISGIRKFNVKCGLSFFEVLAVEECVCGSAATDYQLITSGNREKSGNYLEESFFAGSKDKNGSSRKESVMSTNSGIDKSGNSNPSTTPWNSGNSIRSTANYEEIWTNYYGKNSEEVLLAKTPALALDILHTVEVPDDSKSSDLGSDLEFSNLSEAYVIRVFGGGFVISAGADMIHRMERLAQYYKDCDFLPYVEAEKPMIKSQLSPATADDYDALVAEVPLRVVQMKLKNSTVLVREWDHRRRAAVKKQSLVLEVKLDEVLVELKQPLYRNRLVYTACQLPENELFEKCFFEMSMTLKAVKVDLNEKRICEVSSVSGEMKKLIFPHLWAGQDLQENLYSAGITGLSLMVNPAQLSALQAMARRVELEKDVLRNLDNSKLVVVQFAVQKIKMNIAETTSCFFIKFSVSDLLGMAWKSGIKSLIVSWPEARKQALLLVSVQYPKPKTEKQLLPVVTLQMFEGSINLDPLLREFLSFQIIPDEPRVLLRTISTSTKPAVNDQLQSVQSSSECDATICPQNIELETEKEVVDWVEMYRNFIVNVEVKSLTIYYTLELIETSKPSDSLRSLLSRSEGEMLVMKTPNFTFHSVKNKTLAEMVSKHFTGELPVNLWGNEKAFTWNLSLSGMTFHSIRAGENFKIIEDLSLNISIADETPVGSDIFTGNLLIETSPVVLNIHTNQVELIKSATGEIANFSLLMYSKKIETKVRAEKLLTVIHESPQNTSEIKEFLGLATGSTTTKTSHADDRGKKLKSRCSLYVQWVCSKITINLLAHNTDIQKKFILEIDEILFSLHQQDCYQLKSKIALISGSFYEKLQDDEKWVKNVSLGLSVQSDGNVSDNANRFMDLTITKAETSNVHSRWNIGHKKNRLYNDDITEINVVLQPLDVIANLDELVHFMPIFAALQVNGPTVKTQQPAGSDLPLIHILCSGFRIFLPCVRDDTESPDVLILKVSNLHVTPTAVNNLIRNQILRPDIHSKACSLGILDLAGSKIEDRQYQLIVKGASLSTSNWSGITALINEKTMVESYDNPAFEWNNLENGPKSPNFKLNTIFKDSTFSFIYAPCIRFKDTLVAGTAMEFNCVNDMNVEMTLPELALFISIGEQFKKISSFLKPQAAVFDSHQFTTDEPKKIFMEKKPMEDSGVESISHSKDRRWRKKVLANDDAFEFTFTSSKFRFRCCLEEEDGIMVVLDTPNVFMTQDKYEKSVNISLHDLYIEKILQTRDGTSDLSGIKPSLVRIKLTEKAVRTYDCEINIKRPIGLDFSHEKLARIFKILDLLQANFVVKKSEDQIKKPEALIIGRTRKWSNKKIAPEVLKSGGSIIAESETSRKPQKCNPISSQKTETLADKRIRKFDSIKSHLHDIKTLVFTTSQIVINCKSENYDFKFAVSELRGKLRAFDRPEKIEQNLEVINLTILNRGKMTLHPLNLQAKLKIVQEYWKVDPMMHANLTVGFMRFDINQDLIKDLHSCQKYFLEIFERRKSEKNLEPPRHHENLIQLPPKSFTNKVQPTIEHFQDDLRSGAFQFVETSNLRDLPLPYQIQIVDNDVGVICWRYPLPRALHKIKIFPVPFQTANQVTIVCKIEYYSQLKSQFEEFCEFSLAENETKMLDLKQNRPSAEVWRIKIPRVLLKRDSDDEDEGGDYEFKMHPKVLVACLRIDSYYISSAIPNFDCFIDVAHVEANLMNKMRAVERSPDVVKKFQLLDDRGKEHEAVKVVAKKIKIFGQFFDENYENFELEATIGANVVDYGCGNLVPVVTDFRFKALLDFHHNDVNFNLMTEKIRLKYSPAIGHSVLMTRHIWKENLDIPIHTKFAICNNTANPIGISQYQTNEMICLMPQSFVMYHFRTDKLEQTMQFCVCLRGIWSPKTIPVQIHNDGVEFIKLEENQFFVITIKSLTNFQRQVTIDGTVCIYNLTKEHFRVQYKRYDKDIDAPDKSEMMEFDVGGQQNVSVFGTCLADSQQSIRLRMIKNEKKIFSGEIPLREIVVNNKPWLVKVPSLTNCGFTSFWVRIVRQTEGEISRVLVMIWPMFVTKSLLPMNSTIYEESKDENHVIMGRGETRELDMSGTHEDEHDLLLKGTYAMLDGEAARVMLSYKLINRNSFFKIPDEFSDVKKAIEKLEEVSEEKWPCSRDEEHRAHRDVSLNGPTLPVYHLSSKNPEELSCSLMLTLAPWCSVINSTGCLLRITNHVTNDSCDVEINNITMPFYINSTFTISLSVNDVWTESDPIYINTDIKRTISNSSALPVEGQMTLTLQNDSEIFQLLLTSSIENKMRLIVISSLVVIVNHLKLDLRLFSFAADAGEKIDGLRRNEIPTRKFVEVNKGSPKEQGQPIPEFTDLIPVKGKRKIHTNFSLFLIFGTSSSEFSLPVKIQPTLRKCLSLGSHPISISIVKHNEQFFVSVHNDASPFISISNNTDFNLFVASLESNPSAKYILPHKEISDDRFSWFQTVPSKQQIFYTPPIINEHFPEIQNPDLGLIFACVTADEFVRWSQPVKLDGTKKIIINVPMFGDVKLYVDDSGKTTQVTISYLQEKSVEIMRHQVSRQSFLDINSNYQKTFSLGRKTSARIFNFNLHSKGISCTVFKDDGGKRLEMISLIVDDIGLKYSKTLHNFKINFGKIQVDNELFSSGEYDFPVVLCNTGFPRKSEVSGTSVWDLNEFLDIQDKQEMYSIEIDLYPNGGIENIIVKLQPIRVYIEDTFITFLIGIVDDCLPMNLMPKLDKNNERIKLEGGLVLIPQTVTIQLMNLADPLRIKSLKLEPLHILLSVHTCMRMYIALDHSPLDFSAYERSNIYTLPMKLGHSMGMHYLSSAIFGAGWVVGSLEILGSPSGLARSFTSGIKDFVTLPVQGLFKGPWGFMVGLTQGSASLVSHVTTGTVNSVTKLAASLARNLDRLTLDSEHINLKTDVSRRHRPQGLSEGLQQGLTGFGISILGAIGGLARHPLQARSPVEVVTGFGKGIVGVLAKPISGAAEFVALTGTGMLQSVGYNLLPNPISHTIENSLMPPTADKIISKQLPQYATSNVILFTCSGTFSRKNELKNSFIVLMSHVMVISDLDRDMVMDVVPIERIQPVHKAGSPDNLFVFKIKDDEESPTNHELKYPVSNRTVQYIQQLSGRKISLDENSEEENGFAKIDTDDVESLSAIGVDKKISFYLDETTGKYLVTYVNLIKSQLQSKNNLFPLFET